MICFWNGTKLKIRFVLAIKDVFSNKNRGQFFARKYANWASGVWPLHLLVALWCYFRLWWYFSHFKIATNPCGFLWQKILATFSWYNFEVLALSIWIRLCRSLIWTDSTKFDYRNCFEGLCANVNWAKVDPLSWKFWTALFKSCIKLVSFY